MKRFTIVVAASVAALLSAASTPRKINMVEIPAGHFFMGGRGSGEDFDEKPIHKVTFSRSFRMSDTEITNAQFERFFPGHALLRGKDGLSKHDDEAVVNVSYDDALEFCRRLSLEEGRNYRLPTEAEWEYACRAGSYSDFNTGEGFPGSWEKSQRVARDFDTVSLEVAQFRPNLWGLYDMHGNVEEWCLDWYALYTTADLTDPCGPEKGEYKVTRGGSHHTPVKFLRSSNRSAMLPSDRHSQTGFRIVESDAEFTHSSAPWTAPAPRNDISDQDAKWVSASENALYIPPVPYVVEPEHGSGVPFYSHNHQPAVTWCDNGDLLAIWFSANQENSREMTVLCSRLKKGSREWEPAREFFRVPDRNLTGSSLLNDGHGRLIHLNGVEASGDWQNLAMVMRTSRDNGATWTSPRLIAPEHAKRHQVIAGPVVLADGTLLQCCDAGPGSHDGTAVHLSTDGGETWQDPWDGSPLPDFTKDTVGTTIAGIHAGIVELADGSLLALGRGNSIAGPDGLPRMPQSVSHDRGRTWHYSASPFTPVDGGQRLVLRRLNEGPLLLVAFTEHPYRTLVSQRGMELTGPEGKTVTGHGLYAALSFDDGKTWPVRRLISDAEPRFLDGGAWTGYFVSDSTHAEPRGYLAATQTPDGVIHLLSSRLHYRFNLKWLLGE